MSKTIKSNFRSFVEYKQSFNQQNFMDAQHIIMLQIREAK